MNDKIQTLVDLLRVDPSKITGGGSNVYVYNGQCYWVVSDTEKGDSAHPGWRWIGVLGNIHVFRRD